MHPKPSTTACRLANYVQNWTQITQDRWILESIKGYKIPFLRKPYQWRHRKTRTCSSQDHQLMVGAKRSNGESGTRGKPIHLNTFPSRKRKWKQSVPTSNQPRVSEQICGIDILQDGKSAGGEGSTSTGGLYDEVRLEGCLLHSPSSQGTLALPPVPLSREPKGVSVPTVRPFISPTSLYEDTEASSSSPSVIGNPGSVLPSLSLSLHQDKDKLLTIFHQVLELLQNIVFTVKREKCSAFPTRQLVFLGALLDSMRMILSLPPEKLTAITMAAKEIQQMQNTSLKELSTLLGRMNHAAQTGIWMAPLHYRSLQRDQIKALHLTNNRPELAQITISQSSMEELSWWTSPDLQGLNGQQLQTPPFEITVSTDASLLGWGATWPGTTIGGRWLPKEAQSHKPTGAKGSTSSTFGSLQVMHSTPETCSPTDVPTAVAYVNKRGGTRSRSLSLQATDLWAVVLKASSWVTAKHIPGTSNDVADTASRHFDSHLEWTLQLEDYQPDVFATRVNNQLPQYVSRYPDPGAITTDAFLCDWSQWRSWIYPPLVLIPRILNKIRTDKATALILAPHWKGQSWFPSLLEMLVDYPRQLPQQPGLIMLPFEPETEHPLQHKLHLTVWPVSGNVSIREDFHERLRTYFCHRGAKRPKNATQGHGELGQAGVLHGVSVPLLPL